MTDQRAVDPRAVARRGAYGWRARLGFVTVASTIETPLYELYMMAPPGIAVVSSCLNIRMVTAEAIDDAWQAVAAASREVAAYHLDHLIISGAPLAYSRGSGADRQLIALVEAACGVTTTFELTASIDALRYLGTTRIGIASPFGNASNERIRSFFEAEGFEVSAVNGLGYDANPDITRLPLEAVYDIARSVHRRAPDVEAIYIACPRWPVAPMIEPLESDLGVPIVTSVQSALWAALRALELRTPVVGFGTLLADGLS